MHRAYRNPSSAVPGLWSHTARRSTHLLQEFGREVFNRHPPYRSELAPNDFHLFLHLKKFLSGQRQRFHKERRRWISHSGSNPRRQTSTTQESWSHGMTNVSTPEMNMLKNSSTVTVSVPINISIKLDSVSVNGPKETYFVEPLRICMKGSRSSGLSKI